MYDLAMKPYWRGALEYIHDLDVKNYDEPVPMEELAKVSRDIRICTMNDKIVGFYLINLRDSIGRMVRFVTHAQHRRTGVGMKMMFDLCQKARTEKYRALTCLVDEYNVGAQIFLKSQNFLYKRKLELTDGGIGYLFVREPV